VFAWLAVGATYLTSRSRVESGRVLDGAVIALPTAADLTPRALGQTDQRLIALDGSTQPAIKRLIERDDRRSVIVAYLPDSFTWPLDWIGDANVEAVLDEIGYSGVDGVFTHEHQQATFAPVVLAEGGLRYGPDIHLVGVAADKPTGYIFVPGDLLRVRLDWSLERPAPRPVMLDIRLTTAQGEIGATLDHVAPSSFRAGLYSTYHAIRLDGDRARYAGESTLTLAVRINDGTIARHEIARFSVP
jgi:hypothetical protein